MLYLSSQNITEYIARNAKLFWFCGSEFVERITTGVVVVVVVVVTQPDRLTTRARESSA